MPVTDIAWQSSWLKLGLTPGLGPAAFLKLMHALGDPSQILTQSPSSLARHVASDLVAAIQQGPDPDLLARTLQWLEQPQHHLLTLADADYPPALLQVHQPPPMLYLLGQREHLQSPMLAMVGSRKASKQGLLNAESFGQQLAQAGWTIVSGLAHGIDAAAHQGALQAGCPTIAVIGTGADRVYPAQNRALAHRIAEHGLIMSEFALGSPPQAWHFPQRNRIISGLSRGCLVVEADLQSGSLITARLAMEQGREVFAIPGSIHNNLSKGCHRLIKDGAQLVDSIDDILHALPLASPTPSPSAPQASAPAEPDFLQWLDDSPRHPEELSARAGLTPEQGYAILLELELAGWVASLPGGLYQRIHPYPSV